MLKSKNAKFKFLCLILTIAMVFTILPVWAVGDSIDTDNLELQLENIDYGALAIEAFIAEYGIERWENHQRAVSNIDKIRDSFPQTRMGETIYPSYFGGFYIDDDDNLVTLMVNIIVPFNADPEYMLGLETMLGIKNNERGTIIRQVEFSYADLNAKSYYLHHFALYNPENRAISNASSWFLDIVGNRVVVNLVEFSNEYINLFQSEIIDSPIIIFQECQGITFQFDVSECFEENGYAYCELYANQTVANPLNTVTLHPGQELRMRLPNGNLSGSFSLGFRARRVGTMAHITGFVTTAHVPSMQTGLNI